MLEILLIGLEVRQAQTTIISEEEILLEAISHEILEPVYAELGELLEKAEASSPQLLLSCCTRDGPCREEWGTGGWTLASSEEHSLSADGATATYDVKQAAQEYWPIRQSRLGGAPT